MCFLSIRRELHKGSFKGPFVSFLGILGWAPWDPSIPRGRPGLLQCFKLGFLWGFGGLYRGFFGVRG